MTPSSVRPQIVTACRCALFGAGLSNSWRIVHGKVSARLVALNGKQRVEFNQREDADLIEAISRWAEVTAREEMQARKEQEQSDEAQ